MQLKPLAGYVLIEPVDEEEVTASGLVMPDKEKEKPAKGKVIAIGALDLEARKVIQKYDLSLLEGYPGIDVGQTVIFHRWAGQDVKEDNKEYRLVKFADLMGVYK